ncbi:molecular chaperone [Sphingomonas sinipercae]|uniref:Molecular chaperone n=1 Tax=Sphingomonas sinipercae TaxID=2714944 RepID=A0A6G7ZQJ2_9SPHN|nr:fimbria/pilus periplasmic chaperone [Sphingomonas sinipercae]QIL03195.1 molecular chaperone [Sphingomonas sinipercae]
MPRKFRFACLNGLALALGVFGVQPAAASTFQINPVLVEVKPDKAAALITVDNVGTEPVVIRTKVLAWRQAAGADVYEDTRDIVLSPPLARIAAGGSQVIRLGPKARDRASEKAYRIIIEEVPSQKSVSGTVTMLLRFDVPCFILTANPAQPVLAWKATRSADGLVTLSASNAGGSRFQITSLQWGFASGGTGKHQGRPGTILAGGMKSWKIGSAPRARSGELLTVRFAGGKGEQSVQVPLQPN